MVLGSVRGLWEFQMENPKQGANRAGGTAERESWGRQTNPGPLGRGASTTTGRTVQGKGWKLKYQLSKGQTCTMTGP